MGWSYTLHKLAQAIGADPLDSKETFTRVSTDTRTLRSGDVFFALQGENFDGNAFVEQAIEKGALAVVSNKNTEKVHSLKVNDGLRALQDFAVFHRNQNPIPLIAITGTCGKTSSKDLIAAVLSEEYTVIKTQGNLNNEIGVPMTLLQIDAETDIAVVEMGANHPGEIKRLCEIAQPTESTITMIGAGHLEGFGTIEDVARAKGEIVAGLSDTGTYYLNVDDHRCKKIGESFGGNIVRFGSEGDVVLNSCTRSESGELLLDIDPIGDLILPLPTRAHAQNALLAIAIGLQHNITQFQEPLRQACETTTRLKIYPMGSITVIDDTYNANPDSMRVALEALSEYPTTGKSIAVLGEMGELGPSAEALHKDLGNYCAEFGVDILFARGNFADQVTSSAKEAGVSQAEGYDTHEKMADALFEILSEGDTILFKGSRSTTMEKVIQMLKEKITTTAGTGSNQEG